MDLLKNIDNKEILTEVLHISVDYLIGNINDQQTFKLSHKYGFENPDDFLLTTRSISKYYSSSWLDHRDMLNSTNCSSELRRTILSVLNARQPEVVKHFESCEFKNNNKLVKSFSWDTRLIIGDSNCGGTTCQLVTLHFLISGLNAKDEDLVFQMDMQRLNGLIAILEETISQKHSIL